MEPKIINFTADNQMLVNQTGSICLASGTVEYVGAHFELGENWSGFDSIISSWANFRTVKTAVLDPDGNCRVPTEVLAQKGTVLVNLVGSKVENNVVVERLTTCKIEAATIGCDANLSGSETVPVTPSQFEQFVAIVIAEVQKVTGMSAVAETLPPGSEAYARYEDGVLYLGIPEGAQGEAGADGADGNGISSITLNADYTLTISYTDGTSTTVGPIRGAEGPEGPRGPQGEPGQDGMTPVFSIGNVETLPAGSDAEASITGTPEAPVLNLRIPKGDPGEVTMETLEQILPTDTASGAIASFPDGSDLFPAKSVLVNIDPVQDGTPWISDIFGDPYLQKYSPQLSNEYNRLFDMIVGGTVAWNQLAPYKEPFSRSGQYPLNAGTRIVQGHKYLMSCMRTALESNVGAYLYTNTNGENKIVGNAFIRAEDTTHKSLTTIFASAYSGVSTGVMTVTDGNMWIYVYINDGSVSSADNIMLIDLTQMFGSTIADYIYSLEQANAGAGVAWFKNLFPADYYPYNAGELMSVGGLQSHDVTGKNLLDPSTLSYGYVMTDGNISNLHSNGEVYSDYIPINAGAGCFFSVNVNNASEKWIGIGIYDKDKVFIKRVGGTKGNVTNPVQAVSSSDTAGASFVRVSFRSYDIAENIQLELGSTATAYEPYFKNSYPLDSSLTLRGIPKLDSNNKLYYDGDEYRSDGVVTRKYGVVDLGSLSWSYNSASQRFLSTLATKATTWVAPNALCSAYELLIWGQAQGDVAKDKAVFMNGTYVSVRDTDYTDTATFKTAMSGVMLVYELDTPTTESATLYTNPQIAEPGGFEEYVDNRSVPIPVGHKSSYINEALISGWTGVEVTRTEKNLLDISRTELGTFDQSTGEPISGTAQQSRTTYYIGVNSGTNIVMSNASALATRAFFWNRNGEYIGTMLLSPNSAATIPTGAELMKVSSPGTGFRDEDKFQIETGSTASSYEPYQANTYNVTWQTEAGIVYDGTVDIVSGKLTNTHGIVDLGNLNWTLVSNRFQSNSLINDIKTSATDYSSFLLCSILRPSNSPITSQTVDGTIATYNKRIYALASMFADAASFKAAMAGQQLVYELAEPVEYQLTEQEVEILLGQNNIWATTGDTSVTYKADIQRYIEKKLA